MAWLHLFTYGTLQRHGRYHQEFAADFIHCTAATTWGRLYQLPAGYPMLVVPGSIILAKGSLDVQADLELPLSHTNPPSAPPPPPIPDNWFRIRGELLTFNADATKMARLDELEGFAPTSNRLYDRVLLLVDVHGTQQPAWTYVAPNGKIPSSAEPWFGCQWP